MTEKKVLWTIPNLLSFYRLIIVPVLIVAILNKQEALFAWLFFISLISDILDGWVARTFHLESEWGARLDSWADTATYLVAFWALFSFKGQAIAPHLWGVMAFAVAWLALYLAMLLKFGSVIGLHTYSFKITAYLQGACMMNLLWSGFSAWFYYLAIGWGILACVEEIVIVLLLREPQTNVKGLWWVLRTR